tara:strand:- start:23 stop:292 length:270 start_codon:yes stop_codon:yes gene_type:complete
MKKTNIRINNLFVSLDKKKYYLSDIDDLDVWKNTTLEELKEKKNAENDISQELIQLMEDNNISSNVNFYGFITFDKKDQVHVKKIDGGG